MVCLEQKSWCQNNHGGLACEKSEYIPRERIHSVRYNRSDQKALQKKIRTDNPPRKSTRLPEDESGLTQVWQGKSLYDILSE